jgi:hypothetical protein
LFTSLGCRSSWVPPREMKSTGYDTTFFTFVNFLVFGVEIRWSWSIRVFRLQEDLLTIRSIEGLFADHVRLQALQGYFLADSEFVQESCPSITIFLRQTKTECLENIQEYLTEDLRRVKLHSRSLITQ